MMQRDSIYKIAFATAIFLLVVSVMMATLTFIRPQSVLAADGGFQPEGCCCTPQYKDYNHPCGTCGIGRYLQRTYIRWCDPCADACGGWYYHSERCLPC